MTRIVRTLRAGAAIIIVTSIAVGCNSNTIIEDWGPPAGFARLTGTVRSASGAPAIGVFVQLGRCHPDLARVSAGYTDNTGAYTVSASLPPGIPVRADTVHVTCLATIDFASTPVDSVQLSFAADSLNPASTTHDLRLP